MARPLILVADNSEAYLHHLQQLLERNGYRTLLAHNPAEARQLLRRRRDIRLAVLDLRLEDDSPADDSGLAIAREENRAIPKIILTGFGADVEQMRQAMSLDREGLPAAICLLSKSIDDDDLLQEIERALALEDHFRRTVDNLTVPLEQDYRDAREQARLNFQTSMGMFIVGSAIIFVGLGLVLRGQVEIGIAGAIAGIVIDVLSALAYRRVDVANRRADAYHSELLQIRQFENLLAACSQLSLRQEAACRADIIRAVTTRWFAPVAVHPNSATAPDVPAP